MTEPITLPETKDACEGKCDNCLCDDPALDLKGIVEHTQTELNEIEIDDDMVCATVIYKGVTGISVSHMDDKTTPPGHIYLMMDIGSDGGALGILNFQNGPVKEVGINGVTNEEVLAALLHRTRILNNNFPCKENEIAIDAMQLALTAFESRTKNRQDRGVEGTNQH